MPAGLGLWGRNNSDSTAKLLGMRDVGASINMPIFVPSHGACSMGCPVDTMTRQCLSPIIQLVHANTQARAQHDSVTAQPSQQFLGQVHFLTRALKGCGCDFEHLVPGPSALNMSSPRTSNTDETERPHLGLTKRGPTKRIVGKFQGRGRAP